MSDSLGALRLDIMVNLNGLRRGLASALQLTQQASKSIQKTDLAPTMETGEFLSASKGVQDYVSTVRDAGSSVASLTDRLNDSSGSLDRTLVSLVGVSRASEQAAVSTGMLASSSARIPSHASAIASSVKNLVGSLTSSVRGSRAAAEGLNYFGLVNYDVRKSVESWDWFAVAQGPGVLVTAYDKLRQMLFGIAPPLRLVQKIMTDLVVPSLLAAEAALKGTTGAAGPLASILGASLGKMADEIRGVGGSYTRTVFTDIQNALKLAIGLSRTWADSTVADCDKVIKSFTRVPGSLTKTTSTMSVTESAAIRLSNAIFGLPAKLAGVAVSAAKVAGVRGLFLAIVPPVAAAAISLKTAAIKTIVLSGALGAVGSSLTSFATTIGSVGLNVLSVSSTLFTFTAATFGILPAIIGVSAALFGVGNTFKAVRVAIVAVQSILLQVAGAIIKVIASAVGHAVLGLFARGLALIRSAAISVGTTLLSIPLSIARIAGEAVRATANMLTFGLAFRKASKDINGATGEMKKFESATQSSGRAVQGLVFGLSSLGPGIGIMASLGPTAAAGFAIVAGLGEAIKQAADFEQTTVAFETMLKDAKVAKLVLSDLQQFADVTPFDTGETIASGRALLSFGFAAKDLIPNLTMIGDIAAGVNVDFKELAVLFGQFRAQSKIMTQDLRQLTTRGIPILDVLAKRLGITSEKVFEFAEKGQLGFEHIEAAFKDLTQGSGQFAGLMDKQSKTVGGLFSTLASTVVITLRDIGTVLTNGLNLQGVLSGLISFAQFVSSAVVPAIKTGFEVMAQATAPLFGVLSDVSSTIASLTATVGTWIGSFVSGIPYLKETAVSLAAVLAIVTVGPALLTALSAAVGVFGTILAAVASPIGIAVAGLTALAVWVGSSLGLFQNFGKTVQYAFLVGEFAINNWSSVIDLALTSAQLSIYQFAGNVQHFLTIALPEYLKWFGRNWKNIFVDIFNGTVAIFTNLGSNIKNFFTQIWEFIRSGGTSSFKFTWTPLLEGFKATTEALPEIAKREIGVTEAALQQQVNELAGNLVQGFDEFAKERIKDMDQIKNDSNQVNQDLQNANANAQVDFPELRAAKEKKGKKGGSRDSLSAIEKGSAEDFRAIGESRRGGAGDKLISLGSKQNDWLSKIHDQLKKPAVQRGRL